MRLLFLVSRDDSHPQAAGGDIQGFAYARYLAEAGHQVMYLTSSYRGAPTSETRDGVRIVRLGPAVGLPLQMCRFYRRWGDSFDAVYEEALGGSRAPFCAPLYVRQPLLTAWYQVNGPVFQHQYGPILGRSLGRLERWLARLHRRALVLTPSEARRHDLLGLGFRPEQVWVVPPLALEEKGLEPSALAVTQREPLIVWLGKLRRYKCVHHAVEALARVARKDSRARLIVAGRRDDRGYEGMLRRIIDGLALAGRVDFLFDLSESAKFQLLGRARILVVPSPVEGFGIVILEANACGTPVVVSNGVPTDAVQQGYNGLRVPFGDIPALAEALLQLLSDDRLADALSHNAIVHARSFSKTSIQGRLEEALRSVVSAPALTEVSS